MGAYGAGLSPSRVERRIAGCLELLEGRVTKVDTHRWQLVLSGECRARTTVAVDGDWLVVERALPGCRVTHLPRTTRWSWRLLAPRFSSPSGARAVLPVGETEARIRAERPIVPLHCDHPDPLARWVSTACADAASCAGGGRTGIPNIDTEEPCGATEADLQEWCELAGWPATARSTSGEVVVALPTWDGGVCHAIGAVAGGTVRFHLVLEIVGDGESSPACQAAVALALLRAAGSVRLVRSMATRSDGRMSAALEIRLQTPVDSETLNHALSALAFAHQLIASELEALAYDDSLASAYLALQGAR